MSDSKPALSLPRASRPDYSLSEILVPFGMGLICLILYALIAPYLLPSLMKIGMVTGGLMLIQLIWDYRMWPQEYAIATTFPFGFTSSRQLLKHKWPTLCWLYLVPTMGICRSVTSFLLFQILWCHLQVRVSTQLRKEFGENDTRESILKLYLPEDFTKTPYFLPLILFVVIVDGSLRRGLKGFGIESMAAQYSFIIPVLILIALFLVFNMRQWLILRYYETHLCTNPISTQEK